MRKKQIQPARRPAAVLAILVLVALWAVPPASLAAEPDWSRVRVIAHRGFTLEQPENSLGALSAAVEIGLHGSEMDLRTTADGHLVLLHDETVQRTTGGQGAIADMTLAQARELKLKGGGDQRIPTLEEALDLVAAHPGFQLALDLKALDPAQAARLVAGRGMQGQVVFSISTPENVAWIRAIKAVDPSMKVCLDLLSWWKIEGIPRFAIKALSLDQVFASEWFFPRYGFAEANEAGARVIAYLWGIHDLPARMERAVALGAGAVSCDRPDILLDTVRRHLAGKGKSK